MNAEIIEITTRTEGLEVSETLIELIEQGDVVAIDVLPAEGLAVTGNVLAALNAAVGASGSNPFATLANVPAPPDVTAAIAAHAADHDAHGPLEEADIPATIARDSEVTAALSTAITDHELAVDPHGDRAYADRPRYARIFMLGV